MHDRAAAALMSLWFVACGGGGTATEEIEPLGTGGGEEASAEEGAASESKDGKPSAREVLGMEGPETPWEEMSFDDREFYMIGKVLPIMQEMFAEYDSGEFAELGCESCHGDDMRERNFAMPSPHLPVVPEAGTPGYAELTEAHPEMARFMQLEVNPAMGSILGLSTFSCNGCHPLPEG